MPHFTLQISPQGPVLNAAIMVSGARLKMLKDTGKPIPEPQTIVALIDTGASISGVDPSVLSALGLTPTGEGEILSATSVAVKVPTYDVRVGIYAARQGDVHFLSDTIQVTATDLKTRTFKALLGTDILNKCIFHYNGADGLFTLAY